MHTHTQTSTNSYTRAAYYKDTINGESKYIFLSAGSSLKGQSDRDKFEKVRTPDVCARASCMLPPCVLVACTSVRVLRQAAATRETRGKQS